MPDWCPAWPRPGRRVLHRSNRRAILGRVEDNLMIFGDENGNITHGSMCGSLLYSVVRAGAFVHVAMGTLIDDPPIRPTTPHFRRLQGTVVHIH
jgi:hypothetical protein